ncbi:MAPEG family protein [Parablastomonas sp. CN1-191]|uniref:MAPEG family protein n=1 Tax=Parablastomonas sp. CN1-191 TaxID=3400908 RepID=UPI003BF89A00
MLAPATVLVLWTLVMIVWLSAVRAPAIKAAGGFGRMKPGGRGADLEGKVDDRVNWPSHNYSHLLEQPTLFYAVVVMLAIMGPSPLDVLFAWLYVVLRVVHSIWQATVNRLPLRFTLFALSTLCLAVLAFHAAKLALFDLPGATA